MKKIGLLCAGIVLAAVLTGCKGNLLDPPITMTPTPVPSDMVSETPTPELSPTATPTPSPSPTATPSPTPIPSPTPDISGVTDGGVNGKAVFDENGKLIKAADVEPGNMIYCNNFERSLGNQFAKGNISEGCKFEVTDAQAFHGSDSIHISMRRETTWGLSGAGIPLNETNGLSYKDLEGHTIEIVCNILYLDEGWGVADEIRFALYDTYHTEVVSVPKRNISNDIEYDKDGNMLMVSERRPVLCDVCDVKKGEWTECRFRVTVTKTDAKSGMLMIGTRDEEQNPVGAYVSYYLDDLYIMVIE